MKLPLAAIVVAMTALLGCANVDYPKGWAPILAAGARHCSAINGRYSDQGLGPRLAGQLSVYGTLSVDSAGFRHVEIESREEGTLEVIVTHADGARIQRTHVASRGDYTCLEDGRIQINYGILHGAGFLLAVGAGARIFAKARDGALIVEDRVGVALTVLFLPIFPIRETYWYRYSAYENGQQSGEAGDRPGVGDIVNCVVAGERRWVARSLCDP